MQSQSSPLTPLRGLLEVSRLVRDERDLTRLVERIAATISEVLGFGTVAISLHRPAHDDYAVAAVHGSEGARRALLGATKPALSLQPYFDERFLRRGAYLIPHDEATWEEGFSYVPDLPIGPEPHAWHPEDALLVPLHGADGSLAGFVSVDEPVSGLRPDDAELDLLVAFAQHVADGIEAARHAAEAARDRASLARLLEVSASLVDVESAADVLNAVAAGIAHALEFEKVAVCLAAAGGGFEPVGTAGWEPEDPGLDFTISPAELELLFVPRFEVEGCYLIDRATATSLVGSGSLYASRRNGDGPLAWDRHWLLVPLVDREGALRGFVWADDPVDCLLPSRQRLQALRTFANQATVALRAAEGVEALNDRNRELAALHETAFGLLERLELDSVLHAIVRNAGALAGTPNAYLYLTDDPSQTLRMRVGVGLFASHVGREVRPGMGTSGKALLAGETVVVDDYRGWSDRLEDYDAEAFRAVAGVPLRAGGSVVGVIGIARQDSRPFTSAEVDLLERFARLAELALENARLYAALQQSESLHREIVEHATEVVCLVDFDGRILVASPVAADVLGLPLADLIGSPFQRFVHPDDLADANEVFARAVAGEPMTTTVRTRRIDDGATRVLEASVVAIPGVEGRVLTTARDVTERARLEEQLRQAQKMESIGRLAGGIAHDFNNLLTAIRGYAELLQLDLETGVPPDRDSVAQIARAAERAASLTGQLLAFSRKQVLRPDVIDLNEVVGGMAEMLARVLGEDVVLSTELDPELGRTHADPTQLEQVLLNLAINARDAMPRGGRLTLRTWNADTEDGPHVALAVSDTGSGMDTETAAQVFEPFFTTKEVGQGTGLGLATVHGIVAQSGGSIGVESEPGRGTTFTVLLPRADA